MAKLTDNKKLFGILTKVLPEGSKRNNLAKTALKRFGNATVFDEQAIYNKWISSQEQLSILPVIADGWCPLISIIVPAYNTPDKYLNPLIDSVLKQIYTNWELILVQGSTDSERIDTIRTKSLIDSRIKIIEGPDDHSIAANTNAGISEASGEYIAFLDHDDTLAIFALNEIVSSLQQNPDTDWFYSDEDKLSDDGKKRLSYFFKPGWSPDLLLSVNYMTHFCVVRSSLVHKIGGIRIGFDGAQDYDFALRLLDLNPKVTHIPKVLYHWRLADGSTAISPNSKSSADDAGQKALSDYIQRNGIEAEVIGIPDAPTNYRLKYDTPGFPKASLIIPFLDKANITKVMVSSILERTDYPNYEVLLINNNSREPETAAYLESLDDKRIKILNYTEEFNWSAINNYGAAHANGSVYVFLNNDMKIINNGWLTELVGVAMQPKSGAVGGLLFYPDGTIQHSGVGLGFFGVAGHVFRTLQSGAFTIFGRTDWPRNYLAVTGACIAVHKSKYQSVDGFDESFQTAGSDVAFGIALYEKGFRNIFWPYAKLTHYEGVSVGVYNQRKDTKNDYDQSMRYYRPYLNGADPYLNSNFELNDVNAEKIILRVER